jgi:hypothetical protein
MADRMTTEDNWGYAALPLTSSSVAVKGELACIDTSTGKAEVGGTSETLLPIGYFLESKTGDGTETIKIRLFQEAKLHWWDNDDSPNEVAAADVGSEVYIKDGRTVSTLSTNRSKAGRVWAVDANLGVLIEAGIGVTGPTGATGDGVTGGSVATTTALKAVAAVDRADGMIVMVRADGSLWRFVSASTAATDVAEELVLIPGAGTGRWLRADKSFIAKIPVAFGMDDTDLIWTIPVGMAVRLVGLPFWEVTTEWDGGSASTIGVSSTVTGYDTPGDILGGAAGDANATLQVGVIPGTIGAELDNEADRQAFVMIAGDDLVYDEITSAFTSGAGFVCVPVAVMHTA